MPLVSSRNAVGQLKRGEIDYCVVAIKNSRAGIVAETLEVLRDEHLELVGTEVLPIRHALFKKSREVHLRSIVRVISHEQALRQCSETLSRVLPGVELVPIEDTAIGARHLAEGRYDERTAVLCRLEAGEMNGLALEKEDLQDDPDNRTEFRMFRMPTVPVNNEQRGSWKDRVALYAIDARGGLGYLTQGLMILAIFLAFYVKSMLGWSNFDTATALAGVLTAVFLFLTSAKLRNRLQYRSLEGYWKYFAIPEHDDESRRNQRYETPRVVRIEEVDGELTLKGWLCDRENVPLFKSDLMMMTPLGRRAGSLVYWYSDPKQMGRDFGLSGIVTLSWELADPSARINVMSGWYTGRTTSDTGSIEYVRITKDEYDILRMSDYV